MLYISLTQSQRFADSEWAVHFAVTPIGCREGGGADERGGDDTSFFAGECSGFNVC